MFDKVLIAYDGSAPSRAGLDFSLDLARAFGSRILVVHVLEPDRVASDPEADQPPRDPEEARVWLSELCERSSTVDLPALTPVALDSGRPVPALLEVAEREGPDLIVAGRTGRHGIKGLLLGSVAERLVRGAGRSVAVFPAGAGSATPPQILAGYDGSPESEGAVRVAGALAAGLGAGLMITRVLSEHIPMATVIPDSAVELMHERCEAGLQALSSSLTDPPESVVQTELRTGDPRAGMLKAVREHRPRLLVLGVKGAGGFPDLVLGGTASELVRSADCPVLVVKGTPGDHRATE